MNERDKLYPDKSLIRKTKKRYDTLLWCLMYLTHEPNPSFIEKEIDRVTKRITAIQNAAHEACEGVDKEEKVKAIIKDLYKKYNMSHLQDMLSNLKFYKQNVLQHNKP